MSVDVDSKSGVIKMRGPEEAIRAALAIVTEVCGLDKKTIEIPLDPRATAVFVGKGGANVRRLQEEYGVVVNVHSAKNVVSIRGDPDKVGFAAMASPASRNRDNSIQNTHTLYEAPPLSLRACMLQRQTMRAHAYDPHYPLAAYVAPNLISYPVTPRLYTQRF